MATGKYVVVKIVVYVCPLRNCLFSIARVYTTRIVIMMNIVMAIPVKSHPPYGL